MNKDSESMVLKNSIYTPKKATWFKRILAFLLDVILFAVLVSGMMLLLSFVLGYQRDLELLEEKYIQYGIYVLNNSGTYEFCTTVNNEACLDAWEAFNLDAEACAYYDSTAIKTIPILIGGIFFSELILDFIVPLFIKNGRTIGMFCLGIAYLDTKDIQITSIQLFIHFLFGKFLVVSALPVFFFLMHFFNLWPNYGLLVCLGILLVNVLMKFFTPKRMGIADSIGKMYLIDNESQVYCKTVEELSALKAKEAREKEMQKKTY